MSELIGLSEICRVHREEHRADPSRSRYSVDGDKLFIEPGSPPSSTARNSFRSSRSNSRRTGKRSRRSPTIRKTKSGDAQARTKMLSTIAAEGDGRRQTVTFNDLPPHLDQGDNGHRGPSIFRTLRRQISRHRPCTVAALRERRKLAALQSGRIVDHAAARKESSADE